MKSARWLVMTLALLLAFASSGCGCCTIPIDIDPPEPRGRNEKPKKTEGVVDLGDAEFPRDNKADAVNHPWWLPRLKPKRYRLGYKLPGRNAKEIHNAYLSFSRRVGHRKIDKNRFQWRPPRRCMGGLHCVYEELDEGSVASVEPIAELFRKRAGKAELSALDLAALVITFTQEIRYRIPEAEPFGVKPPALTVKEKWGDCDSKSLLAHMLLRSLSIRSVLISSDAHKHTMLGLALPAPGKTFTWKGTRFAFVELTAKRSPIGHINPKLLRPSDWRVVPMRYRNLGPPSKGGSPQGGKRKKERSGAVEIIGGGRIRVD